MTGVSKRADGEPGESIALWRKKNIFLQLIVVSNYKHAQIEFSITCVLQEQHSQEAHIIYNIEIITLDKKD